MLWHQRLGHINMRSLKNLESMSTGMKLKNDENKLCEACLEGKMTKKPFKPSESVSTKPLRLIHSDVCGPMKVKSLGGSRYFVTFIDDYSRCSKVYFMMNKSEVPEKFKEFQRLVENEHKLKIGTLRSDSGGEYLAREFQEYLKTQGIKHELSVPFCPPQNGVSERYNRTLMESARCMLSHAGLPHMFWAEAVSSANYISNRVPTTALKENKTPFEMLYKRKPDLSNMRVFGCVAYVHVTEDNRSKLDKRTEKLIFVGYSDNHKGFRFYNKSSKQVVIRRDVVYIEDKFEFERVDELRSSTCVDLEESSSDEDAEKQVLPVVLPVETPKSRQSGPSLDVGDDDKRDGRSRNEDKRDERSRDGEKCDGSSHSDKRVGTTRCENKSGENKNIFDSDKSDKNKNIFSSDKCIGGSEIRRKSERTVNPPARYGIDEFAETVKISCENAQEHCALYMYVKEPATMEEALASEESEMWKHAADREMESLLENETWTLCDLPDGREIIKSKWVFKVKYKQSGDIEKYKCRLVAKGYSQQYGIDYGETFSPVVRFTSIRTVLAYGVQNDIEIHQMDVETAFLNGELKEDIFMAQPEGYVLKGNEHLVCKLKKSIYGLKQSPRCWNKCLSDFLSEIGFHQSCADPCVFIRNENDEMIIIAVYVDDLVLLCKDQNKLRDLKKVLMEKFKMKDLGPIHFILGISVTQDEDSLSLCQSQYIKLMLKKYGLWDSIPVSVPADPNIKFRKDDGISKKVESNMYQSMIGSLLYAAMATRPDIAYSVSVLSRYNSDPNEVHLTGVKRIFRYLKETVALKLVFQKCESANLVGYSDANWAGDLDDRRSMSGNVFLYSLGAISWVAKKQLSVTLSTAESEYVALCLASQEAMWLRVLLKDLGCSVELPTRILEDNQGAICIAQNSVINSRSKHIDIKMHYIRERVAEGSINLVYCNTKEMVADIFTKPLARVQFVKLRDKLGLK